MLGPLGRLTTRARSAARSLARDLAELAQLLATAGRELCLLILALAVLRVALSLLLIVGFGVLIARIGPAVEHGLGSREGHQLVLALIALGLLLTFNQLLPAFDRLSRFAATRRMEAAWRVRVRSVVSKPTGIGHLEDAPTLDRIRIANGAAGFTPTSGALSLVSVVAGCLVSLGGLLLIARYSWLIALGLLTAVLVYTRGKHRITKTTVRQMMAASADVARSGYTLGLLHGIGPAKENRVFGLAPWLLARYDEEWRDAHAGLWAARRWIFSHAVWVYLLYGGSYGIAFWLFGRAAAGGDIGVGEMTVLVQACARLGGIASMGEFAQISGGREPLKALRALAAELPVTDAGGLPVAPDWQRIRFEDVRFRYPGREHEVFAGLDLTLERGQSLAVVGLNGAGKTTLIKLLGRMHEPTSGRITLDGVDIRTLDLRQWRAQLAVIFQDFTAYALPAADNVRFGAPALQDETALSRAATRAGAASIVEGLPRGWDTVLAKGFDDGVELSGGQWQRMALARAMYAVEAGAGVLVLDEPTASLDVRAEAELYDSFVRVTEGLTTILVSHRFSTVRCAERIVVLDDGRLVEDGTHEELLRSPGRYADLFLKQAAHFQVTDLGEPADA